MMRTLTPSNIDPWSGTPVEGNRYTAEQLRMLAHDPAAAGRSDLKDRLVKLTWPGATQWTPPTVIWTPCPILATSRGGARVLVITPGGFKKWVAAA